MTSSIALTLIDGVKVVVPNSLDLITPYVLFEQQDWFEDEIKFLRHLLKPGQKIIDIGANYGVYTLTVANTIGSTGCVWAFEPASSTAKFLAEGVAANEFTQVVLEQSALSNTRGTAQLSLNSNSELNALVHDDSNTNSSETVNLTTLDECMDRYGWQDIAFIKIDAEGEEANILRGGERFFAEQSPLVQYEIRAGADLHFELTRDFAALGYDSYQLVPGLNLLIPFESTSKPDEYLLNLFCCKRDCAERLIAQGILVNPVACLPINKTELIKVLSKKGKNLNAFDWQHTIAKLPYGKQLAPFWKQTMRITSHAKVSEALLFYALSQDSSLPSVNRFGALKTSFDLLNTLCEQDTSQMHWASLARVARDYGARSLAIDALVRLRNIIQQQGQIDLSLPFLAPCNRFDTVSPGEVIGDWVFAAVLEELERLCDFSSFYSGLSTRPQLEAIQTLGFGGAEMERRLHLLQMRFNLPSP